MDNPQTEKDSLNYKEISIGFLICILCISVFFLYKGYWKLSIPGFAFIYTVGLTAGFSIKRDFTDSQFRWELDFPFFCTCILWPIVLPLKGIFKVIKYIWNYSKDFILFLALNILGNSYLPTKKE